MTETIQPIETESEYQTKLLEGKKLLTTCIILHELCDQDGKAELEELEKQLSDLTDALIAWEDEHYPMEKK